MAYFDYVSEKDIAQMRQATVTVLEQTGIRSRSPRFLKTTAALGLKVEQRNGEDFGTIYFRREQIEKALATAPSLFSTYGLGTDYEIKWGERRAYNHTCVGTPFIEDLQSGEKRNTTLKDLEDYIRLADYLPSTDIVSCLTAQNISEHAANAIQTAAMVKNTEKPLRICIESAHETADVTAILAAATGGIDALRKRPIAYLEISSISPLDYAVNPAEALLDIVEAGLPLGIIPCPMMGATGPMTLIGSVVMHNAEILAGLVIAQLLKPGHPTIMSPRVTFMDMHSAMGLWAAPEMGLAAAVSAQLVRSYGLPCTVTGFSCAAKTTDAQAGYEAMFNALLPAMVGVDVVGASGSLDNVLIASFEKLVVDNEIGALVQRAVQGETVNEETMAVEVIHAVANGERNFLSRPHTLKHLRSELWQPYISQREPYEAWAKEKKSAARRGKELAEKILSSHRPSPLSPERLQAVDAVLERVINQNQETGN